MSRKASRRSFLGATSATVALQAGQVIPGFDQTRTEVDRTKSWQPFSNRRIRMGLVGYGLCKFAAEFEFQNHPNVEVVAVSDLFPDRCAALAQHVKCSKTYPSLEEMVKDDRIEAIFVATDAPSHARHCIEALNHGKHVYTAVPAFRGDIEDAERLLECVRRIGVWYMPCLRLRCSTMICMRWRNLRRKRLRQHRVLRRGVLPPSYDRYTPAGIVQRLAHARRPMWYPTHATAYYVGVTHDSFVEVSCLGTAPFDEAQRKANRIGNVFNSEVGLFQLARAESAG